MAKFYGKNKDGVRQSVFEQAKSSLGLASFKAGGRLRTLLEVIAELFYSLKTEDLEGLLDQVDYTRATGSHLQQLAMAYGIVPRSAGKAQGTVLATAKKAGTLRAGSWLTAGDLRFKAREDVPYRVTGAIEIPVEAEFAGSKYNLISGSVFRFSSVNLDLTLQPASASFPAAAGRDAETDSMLRRRIAARFTGAFAMDLQKSRCEDVIYSNFREVEQVKILRTPIGAGSVDIYIKTAGGLPSIELLEQIRTRLRDLSLVARDLRVLAPAVAKTSLDVRVANAGDVEGVRTALKRLVDHLLIGDGLSVQDLYMAVQGFEGVEIVKPNGNLAVADYQLLVLGDLEVAYALH